MAMLRYLSRRLLGLVLTLFGVTILTFFVSHLVPSDPTVSNLGPRALSDPAIVAAFKAKWGLDRPLLVQYALYMKNLVQGDLGTSITTHRSVATDLRTFFPASFELATPATLFAAVSGVLAGALAAAYRGRWFDYLVRTFSMIGVSVPSFWLGLVALYGLYYRLGWFPGPGQLDMNLVAPEKITGLITVDSLLTGNFPALFNALGHMVLPAIVLGSFMTGLITRTTRSSMLEVLGQDFTRTARAKGLAERTVLFKHALGNAMIPALTLIGLGYGNLLGGTVLVETIFAWPGLGRYAYQATTTLDFPAIMGVTLVVTSIFLAVNLVVDLLYSVLDPRVRYT